MAAVLWGIAYSYSVLDFIPLAFKMIVRDFLLSGVIMATILW